jgi:phosphatidylglycerophosphate synthase
MDQVRSQTYKGRDAWWTVVLVDPLAGRLVRFAASRTSLTPNQLSVGALVLGLGSAACYWQGTWAWLVAGALIYHVSFVLDCMDGKVARLKGTGTVFGGWLDYVFDRIRVLICTLALVIGQFNATGRTAYLYLGIGIVFLDMLRYIDALKIAAVRREMLGRLHRAQEDTDQTQREAITTMAGRLVPEDPDGLETAPIKTIDLQQGFRSRFSWYLRVRDGLARRRIRPHLISGVEFQMAVFIIGPLTNAIIPVTLVAGTLMLIFETAIIYKLWLSSKDFTRMLADLETTKIPARL